MTKQINADDTLKQLWTIKDQTAKRFGTAAAYFEYLKQQQGTAKAAKTASKSHATQKSMRPRSSGAVR